MHLNDWPIVCLTISTLLALLARRWIDAGWAACFAIFMIFDRILPAAIPGKLKYAFLGIGVILIAFQVAKNYSRYKKSLVAR
jgi:uncharacterized membrane protein YhaH (DUF805 family)